MLPLLQHWRHGRLFLSHQQMMGYPRLLFITMTEVRFMCALCTFWCYVSMLSDLVDSVCHTLRNKVKYTTLKWILKPRGRIFYIDELQWIPYEWKGVTSLASSVFAWSMATSVISLFSDKLTTRQEGKAILLSPFYRPLCGGRRSSFNIVLYRWV